MLLLQRSPALTPIKLLEHLQHQKLYVEWISLQDSAQSPARCQLRRSPPT